MCCVAVSEPHCVRDLLVRKKMVSSSLQFLMAAFSILDGTSDQLAVLAHHDIFEVALGGRFDAPVHLTSGQSFLILLGSFLLRLFRPRRSDDLALFILLEAALSFRLALQDDLGKPSFISLQ